MNHLAIVFLSTFGLLGAACDRPKPSQPHDMAAFAVRMHELRPDSMVHISSAEFDALVEHLSTKLRNVPIEKLTNVEHINLMRSLNTFMFEEKPGERFHAGRYAMLSSLIDSTHYVARLPGLFPEWHPNRGMGFYFVQLDMELYGTPSARGRFDVHSNL
ncbi:MAG TPA: hypothetical protein PK760_02270 [Flavobacteriales bacterium]|nr:hypothetical protein [Flavobacteriales bacterium]